MLAHNGHQCRLTKPSVALALILPLAACADAQKRMYISSDTVVGLDVSLNTARQSGRVQLGYDRYFVTFIPQSVELEGRNGTNKGHEAMSALNCTELTIGNFSMEKFEESLATGEAAVNFAQNINNDAYKYFDCYRDDSKTPTKQAKK